MSRAHVLAAWAACLGACAPSVVWTGYTADRRHRLDVKLDGDGTVILVDGRRDQAHTGIATSSIALAGAHIAFAARQRTGTWRVVLDGADAPGSAWDGIGNVLVSSSGRVAYTAERGGGWYVVVDRAAGPRYDAIVADSLQLAGGGVHVAYAGEHGGQVRWVVDDRAEALADAVGPIAFSANGAHHAYAAKHGPAWVAVVDGTPGAAWPAIGALAIGATGHVAYAAADGRRWRVVTDDVVGAAVDQVDDIAWSDGGAHLAWSGRIDGRGVVALDGTPVCAMAKREPGSFAFRPGAAQTLALACAVQTPDGRQAIALVDANGTTRGAPFDAVGAPVWSANGVLAFTARTGGAWHVIFGDLELPAGDHVETPVWSPTRRLGFVYERGPHTHVVVDNRDYAFDFAFEDTFAFSRDGAHWAILAGDRTREQMYFAIDGTVRVPLDPAEIYSAVQDHATTDAARNGERIRAWSAAEADLAAH